MPKVLVKILRFAVNHWLSMLLTMVGTAIGGKLLWLYRMHLKKWLLFEHSLEMVGWMWILSLLIASGLAVAIIWLYKKTKRRILYREDGEILIMLESKLRELESEKKSQIPIDFRIWDRKLSLVKGKAEELLPQVVETDETWKIKKKSGNVMTIIRDDPVGRAIKRGLEA